MDPMDDDIFYPDDGGGGGMPPTQYGHRRSTHPPPSSNQFPTQTNPLGRPLSESATFVQLQPPPCPMPSQGQIFGHQGYHHQMERQPLEDPESTIEDPESTIRPAQLESMLQGGTGDFESTWTQSEFTEQMRIGSSSAGGRDVYGQREDSGDLFDDLELISDSAGYQTLSVMEHDMIMQHSVPQQQVLPELSNQFLEIHLNSQPQSTTSSTSSVFHSGDASAAPSGPCDSSQNSPSGVFLSHSTENTSVPIASSSALTSQSGSHLQRNFSDRQPFSGHLDVKQILKYKLQGKQRDRIQSDPARPLLQPMSPCDLYNQQQQHPLQPHQQRPGSVQVKFRSPCVSVGTAESLRDDEEASIRRTNLVIERRKERNRQSAARARERQKTKQSDLEHEKAKLTEENASLSREVEALEAERDRLQTLVLSHTSTCTYEHNEQQQHDYHYNTTTTTTTTSSRHHNQQLLQQQTSLLPEQTADTTRTEPQHQQEHKPTTFSGTYSESFQPSPEFR